MAAIKANVRTKVKTLKSSFKKEYGVAIRIYDGSSFADDNVTLAKISKGDSDGSISISANMKVGNLEKKFKDTLGLKIQIEDKNGNLADNNKTLATL